jgi:hypothetical protein
MFYFIVKCNLPKFYGNKGLIAADNWITSHEDLADSLRCTEEHKVDYAGLKFRGEAKNWWKFKKLHLTGEYGQGVPIPWERLKQEFNDCFFPLQQCERDFQDLKPGSMSVEQYSNEFQRLSRYAPNLIPDEELKVERFHDGLAPQILERIIFVKVTDYTEMVYVATMA